jgi:hypothetical protein
MVDGNVVVPKFLKGGNGFLDGIVSCIAKVWASSPRNPGHAVQQSAYLGFQTNPVYRQFLENKGNQLVFAGKYGRKQVDLLNGGMASLGSDLNSFMYDFLALYGKVV